MGKNRKKIFAVSSELLGVTEEVVDLHRKCAEELGADILAVSQIRDLFTLICDPDYRIDIISIDLDSLGNIIEHDLFDEMTALVTMLNTMPGSRRDGTLGVRETVIVGSVRLDTDPAVVKEFLSTGDRICGIFPGGPEFSKDEKFQAMSSFLSGQHHVPERVQKMLRQRKLDSVSKNNLTPRQRQILSLITKRGSSNKVIAKILNISESTVKLHLGNIFKKYGVRNRTQLALFSQSDQK
jgi:DNA-binding CsgD family transcriptional regulator